MPDVVEKYIHDLLTENGFRPYRPCRHGMIYHDTGGSRLVAQRSYGDPRTLINFKAQIRRAVEKRNAPLTASLGKSVSIKGLIDQSKVDSTVNQTGVLIPPTIEERAIHKVLHNGDKTFAKKYIPTSPNGVLDPNDRQKIRDLVADAYRHGKGDADIAKILIEKGYKRPDGRSPDHVFVRGQIVGINAQLKKLGQPVLRLGEAIEGFKHRVGRPPGPGKKTEAPVQTEMVVVEQAPLPKAAVVAALPKEEKPVPVVVAPIKSKVPQVVLDIMANTTLPAEKKANMLLWWAEEAAGEFKDLIMNILTDPGLSAKLKIHMVGELI